MRFLHFIAVCFLGMTACAAPSRSQRVQEAAYELNVGLRFGQTAVALEKVASQERGEFLKRHRQWNRQLRIVDVDLVGMNIQETEAEVYVTIQWQHEDFSDVRSTVIRQHWKDNRGSWQLVSEAHAQGDQGLFGDETRSKEVSSQEDSGRRYQTTIIR